MGLLEVKDIWVHYGRVEAIRGISITVEENTIVSIVGSNGAGKTTTLKAVFGLKKTTSGKILFRGKRVDGLSPQEIAKLGI